MDCNEHLLKSDRHQNTICAEHQYFARDECRENNVMGNDNKDIINSVTTLYCKAIDYQLKQTVIVISTTVAA